MAEHKSHAVGFSNGDQSKVSTGCILVAGGAGYIGSHTVIEVIKSGYSAVVVDSLCNSSYGLNILISTRVFFIFVNWLLVQLTSNISILQICI